MSYRLASLPLFVIALAACGSDDPAEGTGGSGASSASSTATSGQGGSTSSGTTTSGAGGNDPGFVTVEKHVSVGTIDPGQEDTVCLRARLDNAEGVYVRRFRTTIEQGSHHVIVYKSTKTDEQLEPSPCGGFAGLFAGEYPIYIAQQEQTDLSLPTDAETGKPVGFHLDPQQMLLFEVHYINTTGAPIDIGATVSFDTVPDTDDVIPSDFAFWGTVGINIPPASTFQTPVKFQKALDGSKVFAITTHQHQLGTRMRVWHSVDKNDVDTLVADGTDWANPPLELFDPPLTFGDKKGFSYQCEWNNTTNQQVGFGEGFNDEMCFLWHYYYPSQGFQYCTDGVCKTVN